MDGPPRKTDDGAAGRGGRSRPDAESQAGGRERPKRPVLTEKQRREAREARQRARKQRSGEAAGPNPLVAGIRATGRELRRTFAFLGDLALAGLAGLAPVGAAIGRGILAVGRALIALLIVLARAAGKVAAAIGRAARRLDGVLTPTVAVIVVAIAGSVMLGYSQTIEYRAVEIGQAGYQGILDVTRPPQTDGRTPIDTHSFVLVAASLLALVASVAAASGRRWAALPIFGVGLLTLAVVLLIDLPAGTDAAGARSAYAGAEPVLLSGFWLQLAAGAALLASGLLMLVPDPRRRSASNRARRRGTIAREAA